MSFDARAWAFHRLCEKIKVGTLRLTDPQGRTETFGAGEPVGEMIVRDWRVAEAALLRGDVGLGEAYAEGAWDSPDIEALIAVALANAGALERAADGSFWTQLAARIRNRVMRANSRRGSRRNIRAHYDVGNDFYALWLDRGLTYSSALFAAEDEPLERAQDRKYDRLLATAPGERLLEIGCGWGGLAERAADQGREVTAVTVSKAQHAYAARRLGRRADVRLQDYRDVDGRYDSIVSVEMIEAVGERYWPRYFETLKQRLAPGGFAALQAIVVADSEFERYRRRTDYIRAYTFPGGMLPSPAAIQAGARKAGLEAEEFFAFGLDYARTLRRWLARFEASTAEIRALGRSESFIRSWRYYLSICAAAFADQKTTDVVHVRLRHA